MNRGKKAIPNNNNLRHERRSRHTPAHDVARGSLLVLVIVVLFILEQRRARVARMCRYAEERHRAPTRRACTNNRQTRARTYVHTRDVHTGKTRGGGRGERVLDSGGGEVDTKENVRRQQRLVRAVAQLPQLAPACAPDSLAYLFHSIQQEVPQQRTVPSVSSTQEWYSPSAIHCTKPPTSTAGGGISPGSAPLQYTSEYINQYQ